MSKLLLKTKREEKNTKRKVELRSSRQSIWDVPLFGGRTTRRVVIFRYMYFIIFDFIHWTSPRIFWYPKLDVPLLGQASIYVYPISLLSRSSKLLLDETPRTAGGMILAVGDGKEFCTSAAELNKKKKKKKENKEQQKMKKNRSR